MEVQVPGAGRPQRGKLASAPQRLVLGDGRTTFRARIQLDYGWPIRLQSHDNALHRRWPASDSSSEHQGWKFRRRAGAYLCAEIRASEKARSPSRRYCYCRIERKPAARLHCPRFGPGHREGRLYSLQTAQRAFSQMPLLLSQLPSDEETDEADCAWYRASAPQPQRHSCHRAPVSANF